MFNIFIFQDRIAPPFPPAPRTPATTSEFQPPYFPPPFAPHGMLQVGGVGFTKFSRNAVPGPDGAGGGVLLQHAAAQLRRPLSSHLHPPPVPNTAGGWIRCFGVQRKKQ